MHGLKCFACAGLLVLASTFTLLSPAYAQIETNLSAYTGQNAEGYLNPLKEALGAALNSGTYHSAAIPTSGFTLNLEIKTMIVKFGDSDDSFTAQTESGFLPPGQAEAPTVVGSTEALVLQGQNGTAAVFPGGLDLNSVGIAVPQITVGTVAGTQLIGRYVAFETGDAEIGDLSLFGIGARHSISQYLTDPPLDLSAGLMYQSFELGDDFVESSAFTVGVQGSRKFYGVLEPFVGLSYDTFSMSVKYDTEGASPTTLDVDFDSDSNARFTAGLGLSFPMVHLSGAVDLSSQTSFTLGLSLGN